MNIIVTGFGAFLSHQTNPTSEVLRRLPKTLMGHSIIAVEVPVEYDTCFSYLQQFLDRFQPDIVLLLGLASGSTSVRLERLAINLKDSVHPDNTGTIYTDSVIADGGELAYSSTLPLRAIAHQLQQKNIPVTISNTAGLYVCNNLFYHTMHYITKKQLPIQAGFVHVPDMEQSSTSGPSLPLSTIVEAVMDSLTITIEQKE